MFRIPPYLRQLRPLSVLVSESLGLHFRRTADSSVETDKV